LYLEFSPHSTVGIFYPLNYGTITAMAVRKNNVFGLCVNRF
jgi:hypothetical protein